LSEQPDIYDIRTLKAVNTTTFSLQGSNRQFSKIGTVFMLKMKRDSAGKDGFFINAPMLRNKTERITV